MLGHEDLLSRPSIEINKAAVEKKKDSKASAALISRQD